MTGTALRLLLLTGLFKVVLCFYYGKHVYIEKEMNWSEARGYCRTHHTDLSSINDKEQNITFNEFAKMKQKAWIGLYKDGKGDWKWSGGKTASFFNWAPNNTFHEERNCVLKAARGWRSRSCGVAIAHLYCFDSSLVLVMENKTWEEAMEHCRHLNMELISLLSDSALVQALQASSKAQTDRVWTGLRYLADSWFWVDRSMEAQRTSYHDWNPWEMPQCPDGTRHCGALSLKGDELESWDCADKLNFLCYKKN